MDEDEYKDVYHSVNRCRCVFEKASLTRRYQCRNHIKIQIGEREAAGCSDETARQQCAELLRTLRRQSAFSLKMPSLTGHTALPHAKELKVQCGGLNGLYSAINGSLPNGNIEDIRALVQTALKNHGGIDHLPWQTIIQGVTGFSGRRRRRHNDP